MLFPVLYCEAFTVGENVLLRPQKKPTLFKLTRPTLVFWADPKNFFFGFEISDLVNQFRLTPSSKTVSNERNKCAAHESLASVN